MSTRMSASPRALPALLTVVVGLTLAGCGQGAESALASNPKTQSSVAVENAPTAGAATTPAPAAVASQPVAQSNAPEVMPVVEERPVTPAATTTTAATTTATATRPASATPTPKPAAPKTAASTPTPRPAATTTASTPAATPTRARAFVAAGTQIAAAIEDGLATDKNKEGDRFHAIVSEDVLGSKGEVLLPKGAVVNGRVAASRASTGPTDPATLTLEVESILVGSKTLALTASVVQVDAQIGTRDSGQKTAVKVGAGAAAGAVLGKILGGDKKDALKGAVAGAAAGAAVAAATKDGQAVVKPGAKMVLQLTDRLFVE